MTRLSAFGFLTLALALLVSECHGANILFYTGISTASHVYAISPVLDRLAERGHNVTVHTPYLPHSINPKVKVIHAEEIANIFRDQWGEGVDLIQIRAAGISLWDGLIDNTQLVCKTFLTAPRSQALIHNSQFDLVIVDASYNECAVGLAHLKYKCPHILYSALSPAPAFYDEVGIPFESGIPDLESGAPGGNAMSFWDRAFALWLPIKWLWRRQVNLYPKLNAMLKEHLNIGSDVQFDISDIQTRPSLFLINTHFSSDYVRSLSPLFVPVGGIGLNDKRKPLPKEVDTFISKKKGFIYVCFGGAVQIAKADPALRAKLFEAFASFPELQFVWKWVGGVVRKEEKVPENIYFADWLPQQDLLADKRIRGFIGHGGMNGIIEAIHYEVPSIIFPIFGDQDQNAQAHKTKGLSIVLEITDFSQADLEEAIRRLLHDEALHSRVKIASSVSRDRPQPPVDTAVWWIEYVLRHGNRTADFLGSLSARQPWYMKRWLDVWGALFGTAALAFYVVAKLVGWLFGVFGGKKQHSHANEVVKNGHAASPKSNGDYATNGNANVYSRSKSKTKTN